MLDTSQRMDGVHAIQAVHMASLDGCNWISAVSLDVLSCPLLFGVARCN
jgi:hypothetical protein